MNIRNVPIKVAQKIRIDSVKKGITQAEYLTKIVFPQV